MLKIPRADLVPNSFDYETTPLVKPTGFREYDARWLFEKEINLLGMRALGLGIGTLIHEHGVKPEELKVVMELGSLEAIKGLVSTGLGFAVMSRATVAKEIELAQLVAVPLAPRLMRKLSVVYPRERFRSRLVDTFIEFARGRLRAVKER